ncbi:WG repeat-containing protein [Flavobacteriaceae bacterium M23B6Z8]
MKCNKTPLTLMLLFVSINCQAQDSIHLYLHKEKNKSGLIDREGNIVLEPKYSIIGNFKEGKASVTIINRAKNDFHKILSTKLGYINAKGEVVIPFKFQHIPDEIKDFSEGRAVVKMNNKFGYIDSEGKMVIPPKYSRAYPFNEGFAVVESNGDSGNRALIDKNGKVIFYFLEKYQEKVDSLAKNVLVTTNKLSDGKISVHQFIQGGKTVSAVFDSQGELLFTKRFRRINPYVNGITEAHIDSCRTSSANCWVIIDDRGEILTNESYARCVRIDKDTFFVQNHDTGEQKVITTKGDMVPPIIEKGISVLSDDLVNHTTLIRAEKNGRYGYIDQMGKVILDFQYNHVSVFSEGLAFVKKPDRTVLCVDEKGNRIFQIDAVYDANWGSAVPYEPFPSGVYKNGLASLMIAADGYYKLVHIDKTGEFLKVTKK